MPDLPSALQATIDSARTPAVSYAYVGPDAQNPGKFTSTSIAVGKKTADSETSLVDANTRFPASSSSQSDDGYETDIEEVDALEKITSKFIADKGYVMHGPFWSKNPNDPVLQEKNSR